MDKAQAPKPLRSAASVGAGVSSVSTPWPMASRMEAKYLTVMRMGETSGQQLGKAHVLNHITAGNGVLALEDIYVTLKAK